MNTISARLFGAGIVATVVMTAMMMVVAPMMGVHMDIAASLAGMMDMPWAVGMAVHLFLGIIAFPIAFAQLLSSRRFGNPLVRGLVFGGILWLMLEIFVMPMLGAGVFGMNGPGMIGAGAAFMAHMVYGSFLGLIAGGRTSSAKLQAA